MSYDPASISSSPIPPRAPRVLHDYVVMGMINEYMGRRCVEGGDHVESFYPNERVAADSFESHISACLVARGVSTLLQREKGSEAHILFRSRPATALVDSWYSPDYSNASGSELTFEGMTRRTVSVESLPRRHFRGLPAQPYGDMDAIDQRLSYILGAWIRYGKGSSFRFSNSQGKVELVREFLLTMRCPEVAWRTLGDTVPTGHTLKYTPTPVLAAFLGISMNPSPRP